MQFEDTEGPFGSPACQYVKETKIFTYELMYYRYYKTAFLPS